MKYPVVSEFIDKHTKVYYPKGSTYETDNKQRADELQGKGFLGEGRQSKTSDNKQSPKGNSRQKSNQALQKEQGSAPGDVDESKQTE